jgi:hypothetical protein
MSVPGRKRMIVVALLSASYLLPASLLAQAAANPPDATRSNSAAAVPLVSEPETLPEMPPIPLGARSPISFFRELLVMDEAGRALALGTYPPERQAQILAKVREYELLEPNERELRLRVTELCWYLRPLLTRPAAYPTEQLDNIPEPNRSLLKKRLSEWDKLPAEVKRELLGLESTLPYIAEIGGRSKLQRQQILNSMLPEPRSRLEKGLQKWDAMSETQRQRTLSRFNQFFKLSRAEKEKTLMTLSEPERQQIEKTLQTVGKLSEDQRAWCLRSFEKFTSLSPEERQEFLESAERWKLMPPSEREAWRQLVTLVPPPLPPGPPPPPPPLPRPPDTQALATNRN